MRKIEVRIRDNHIAAAKRGDLYANPVGIAMQDEFPGRGLFWFGTENRRERIVWDQVHSNCFRRKRGMDPNALILYRISPEGAKLARTFYQTGRCEPGTFFIVETKKVARNRVSR